MRCQGGEFLYGVAQIATKRLFPTIPHCITIPHDTFEVVHRAEEFDGVVVSFDVKRVASHIDPWNV